MKSGTNGRHDSNLFEKIITFHGIGWIPGQIRFVGITSDVWELIIRRCFLPILIFLNNLCETECLVKKYQNLLITASHTTHFYTFITHSLLCTSFTQYTSIFQTVIGSWFGSPRCRCWCLGWYLDSEFLVIGVTRTPNIADKFWNPCKCKHYLTWPQRLLHIVILLIIATQTVENKTL